MPRSRLLLSLAAISSLTLGAPATSTAQTQTLTFESPVVDGCSDASVSTDGFTSSGGQVCNSTGYGFPTYSGQQAFNTFFSGSYAPAILIHSSPFDALSVAIHGYPGGLQGAGLVAGFLNGVLQGSLPVFLGDSWMDYTLNFNGIDELRFSANDPGHQLVVADDLVYRLSDVTATPEPTSLVLLTTGLVGVFGAARRKRSARLG